MSYILNDRNVIKERKEKENSGLICAYCKHSKKNVDGNGVCLAMTKYGFCGCKKSTFIKQTEIKKWGNYFTKKEEYLKKT